MCLLRSCPFVFVGFVTRWLNQRTKSERHTNLPCLLGKDGQLLGQWQLQETIERDVELL